MLKATRCGRCPILCRRGEFPLMVLPFGKHTKNINKLWKITKIHHFSWENSLFRLGHFLFDAFCMSTRRYDCPLSKTYWCLVGYGWVAGGMG